MKNYPNSRKLDIMKSPSHDITRWKRKIKTLVRKRVNQIFKNKIHQMAKIYKSRQPYLKIKDIEKKITPNFKEAKKRRVEKYYKMALKSKWALEIKKRMGLVPTPILNTNIKRKKEYKDFPMFITDDAVVDNIFNNVCISLDNRGSESKIKINKNEFVFILFLILYEWIQLIIKNYRHNTCFGIFYIKNRFIDYVSYLETVKEKIKLNHCIWIGRLKRKLNLDIVNELNKDNIELEQYNIKKKEIMKNKKFWFSK